MPSKSPAQARFMAAIAHGWKPDKVDAPPLEVAQEFTEADRKRRTGLDALAKLYAARSDRRRSV